MSKAILVPIPHSSPRQELTLSFKLKVQRLSSQLLTWAPHILKPLRNHPVLRTPSHILTTLIEILEYSLKTQNSNVFPFSLLYNLIDAEPQGQGSGQIPGA